MGEKLGGCFGHPAGQRYKERDYRQRPIIPNVEYSVCCNSFLEERRNASEP